MAEQLPSFDQERRAKQKAAQLERLSFGFLRWTTRPAKRAATLASSRAVEGPNIPVFIGVRACVSSFFETSKKPGLAARAFFGMGNVRFCDQKPRKNARSGGRLEQLGRIGLDGFDGFGGDPLGQFGERLGIGGEGLELLAGMRGPQL